MYQSLHPDTVINAQGNVKMSTDQRLVFFPSAVAFTGLFFWMWNLDRRVSRVVRRRTA
jgi:hypothetical protein